jgi:hypothetical protein
MENRTKIYNPATKRRVFADTKTGKKAIKDCGRAISTFMHVMLNEDNYVWNAENKKWEDAKNINDCMTVKSVMEEIIKKDDKKNCAKTMIIMLKKIMGNIENTGDQLLIQKRKQQLQKLKNFYKKLSNDITELDNLQINKNQ